MSNSAIRPSHFALGVTNVGFRPSAIADSIDQFCAQVRTGLEAASFAQRRALVELLIDRVVVTNSEVEIHYVIPTSPESANVRFCHLRKAYQGPATSG